MLDYILDLFSAAQFVPHAVCLLWRPDLLIMHGVSDFLIAAAYLTIPLIILKAVNQRPDLLDPKVARLFAAFITACALSHLGGLLTLWVPAYGFQGAIKVATAAVSIYTAVQLARLLPTFLTMPSRMEVARKEAEIAVEQKRADEAQQARDKMSEFAYIASHDLKAPMRGIANQARFLQEDHGDALKPDARRRLDRMQELCGQLENLITVLLKYSRIGRTGARETVDPAEAVERIKGTLAETLAEKNAEVVVETPLPRIEAIPSEVTTVLQNLIVNALIYNEAEEKRIAIGYVPYVDIDGVRMRDAYYVRDNGIGIPADKRRAVFDMFTRLHAEEHYEGNGLGLSLCERLVAQHGGRIWVEDGEDGGAALAMTLRRAP